MPEDEVTTAPVRRIYGRRRGRPLRPGQRRLHETLLPRLTITLPGTGVLDPGGLFDERPAEVWLLCCLERVETRLL